MIGAYRLLGVIATALAVATAFPACSATDRGEQPVSEVLETSTFGGIENGNLDLALQAGIGGGKNGTLVVTLFGPFASAGGEGLQLDVKAGASGELGGSELDAEGHVTRLPWGANRCFEQLGRIDPGDLVLRAKNEGAGDVAGTRTTEIAGNLDVRKAAGSLFESLESRPCRALLVTSGAPLSTSEMGRLKEAGRMAKNGHIALFVGDDDIVRRLEIDADIGGDGPRAALHKVEFNLDLKVSGVNDGNAIPLTPRKPQWPRDLLAGIGA